MKQSNTVTPPLRDTPLRQVTPADGFRYFAASEHHNLPAMYCHGNMWIIVVARGFERRFPIERLGDAVATYRAILDGKAGTAVDPFSGPRCTCGTPTRLGYCPVHERDQP